MALLVYRDLVTERADFRLLVNPNAAAPTFTGATPAADLHGIARANLIIDPILPAFDVVADEDLLSTMSLRVGFEERDQPDDEWQEVEYLAFGGDNPTPFRKQRLVGGFVKQEGGPLGEGLLPTFPNTPACLPLELRRRFVRWTWTWSPTAFPLLIGLQLEPRRRTSPPGLEVAS